MTGTKSAENNQPPVSNEKEFIELLNHENKNHEFIIRLYKMMVSDLSVSKDLYRKKKYPQAVFYLEQSVEIGWKAYGLYNKAVNDVKKINHSIINTINPKNSDFLTNTRIACSQVQSLPEFNEINDKLGLNTRYVWSVLLEHAEKSFPEMRTDSKKYNFAEDEIVASVASLKEISKLSLTMDKEFAELELRGNQTEINDFSVAIIEIIVSFIPYLQISDELKEKLCYTGGKPAHSIDWDINLIKSIYPIMWDNWILILLNMILNPQLERTRYPIQGTDFDPLTYYTGDLPLVKHMPELFKITDKLTKSLGKHMGIDIT